MELAGVITGGLALIISAILAWKNYFSQFHLSVFCGNPRLEPIPLKLEDDSTVLRFSAILPLYFTNTGARECVIDDIILIVKSDKNEWLFIPFLYTKYSIKIDSTLGVNLTNDPSNEPFYPIHLAGSSKVYKSIIFTIMKYDQFPLGDITLSAGKYTFIVKTMEMDKKKYKTKLVFNITLGEEQIKHLSTNGYLIPFTDEVKNKREKLHS